MFPQLLSDELLSKIERWADLKRWERREIGQELRRVGLCYREIAQVIPVSKGTLSGWCRDLDLSEYEDAMLRRRQTELIIRGRLGKKRRHIARERAAALRREARKEASTLQTDPFWVAGVLAYWAEGGKRSKELSFSNSDPDLIRLFLAWSCRFLELPPDRFTISLHLHAGQDENERTAFWSERTGLGPEQFRKGFIKPEGTGHRKNVLYNGTAQIRVRRSGALLHRALGWIDGLRDAFVYPD